MNLPERALRYLEVMPPSVQGKAGSLSLFNACCALRRGFDLDFDTAWPILLAWNARHCLPPWSEPELRRKLAEAAKSRRPNGYLLQPAAGSRPADRARGDPPGQGRPLAKSWPPFRPLTPAEVQTIAALRQVPAAAVCGLVRHGFLWAASVDCQDCYLIREADFVQARPLDGSSFAGPGGTRLKAKNLPGSRGAFLGQSWLGGPEVRVLIVEGAVALLEAFVAQEWVDPPSSWTVLAATSASSRFARDPGLLRRLAGRKIRLLPDADAAGLQAAASWAAELDLAGCEVSRACLPPGIKDLGPLVANPITHHAPLQKIFS